MTNQQVNELKAFNKQKNYISELALRGFHEEKLTQVEVDTLLNARDNLNVLLDIWDLDCETKDELTKIFLNIINTPEIKMYDYKKEIQSEEEKGTGSDNSLSVAIKKEIHSKSNDKVTTDLELKYISDKDLISMWDAKEYILSNSITNKAEIYCRLGGYKKVISLVGMIILQGIAHFISKLNLPMVDTVSIMLIFISLMGIVLQLINLTCDSMYIANSEARDMLLSKNKEAVIVSPQAIETIYLLEKQGVKN